MIGPYEVYANDKEAYAGFGKFSGGYWMVKIDKSGNVHSAKIKPTQYPQELTKLLKSGYRKLSGQKYIQSRTNESGLEVGVFIGRHPEIDPEMVSVFAALPIGCETQEVANQLEHMLLKTTADARDIENWVRSISNAKQYISDRKHHPAFTIVVASYAIENNLALVTYEQPIPGGSPKDAPLDWEAWLKAHFREDEVRQAMQDLDFTAKNLLATAFENQDTQASELARVCF